MRPIIALTLLIALGAVACKKSDAPAPVTPSNTEVKETPPVVAEPEPAPAPADGRPASVTDDMVVVADRIVGAMEAMGTDLTAAGTDCAKGSAALRHHAQLLRPIAADAKQFEDNKDPAAEEWFKATYMPRIMNAMGGMMTLAQNCASDKDFQLAAEEFGKAME